MKSDATCGAKAVRQKYIITDEITRSIGQQERQREWDMSSCESENARNNEVWRAKIRRMSMSGGIFVQDSECMAAALLQFLRIEEYVYPG